MLGKLFIVAGSYWGCALSGLQSFVYDIPTEDAARRLRARSAALVLLPALIAQRLRKQDSETQFLYLGGGKVLCRTAADDESFLRMLKAWSRELALISSGSLGLYWASGESPERLLDSLREAKWRSGRDASGEWFGHLGAPALVPRRPGPGDPDWEAEVGGTIARNLSAIGVSVGDGWHIVGDARVRLVLPKDSIQPDITFGGNDLAISLPRYVPMRNDELKAFDQIAEEGYHSDRGYPYLGVLKLDGDRVGTRLGEALRSSVDEYRRLSGALVEFYGTRVPEMLQEQRPNVYLVYSGGDDLVAIGHFRDVLETALLVRNEFRDGTTSAGISFFHRRSPMLPAVESADGFLQRSKERGRDRVTVAGQTLTWTELKEALELSDLLVDACKAETIPRSIIHLLRELGQWFLEGEQVERLNPCRALPLLSYFLSRRRVDKDSLRPELQRYFANLCDRENAWKAAALIATLASWKLREAKE